MYMVPVEQVVDLQLALPLLVEMAEPLGQPMVLVAAVGQVTQVMVATAQHQLVGPVATQAVVILEEMDQQLLGSQGPTALPQRVLAVVGNIH